MQPINPTSPLMGVPQEGITPRPPLEQQKAQLKEQVEEFASLLYAQMFQGMREAGKTDNDEEEKDSVFGGGDTDLFMHFLDESVGKNFIKQGGGSLNDALYKQLAQRLDIQAHKGDGK